MGGPYFIVGPAKFGLLQAHMRGSVLLDASQHSRPSSHGWPNLCSRPVQVVGPARFGWLQTHVRGLVLLGANQHGRPSSHGWSNLCSRPVQVGSPYFMVGPARFGGSTFLVGIANLGCPADRQSIVFLVGSVCLEA